MLENIFEIRRRDLSIESNKAERKERKLKKKKKNNKAKSQLFLSRIQEFVMYGN